MSSLVRSQVTQKHTATLLQKTFWGHTEKLKDGLGDIRELRLILLHVLMVYSYKGEMP